MSTTNVFLGVAIVSAGGIAFGIRSLLAKPGPAATTPEIDETGAAVVVENGTERQHLEEMSWLWTEKELHLEKISFLWREPEESPEVTANVVRPHFNHSEIEQFYDEFIAAKPVVRGSRRTVIVKILQLLDTDGDSPSVVGKGEESYKHESEKDIGDELYQFLSMVPLWKHSLLVARKYAAKFQYDVMLPDALIIALGHDLGKLPRYYKKLYKSGDHPALSTNILNGMPEYAGLPNRNELNRIIMGHHLMAPGTPLADQLKAADGEARTEEGEGLIAWLDKKEAAAPVAVDTASASDTANETDTLPKVGMSNSSSTTSRKPGEKKAPVPRETQLPLGPTSPNVYAKEDGSNRKGKHVCTEMPLPEWWDKDKILSVIGRSIDKIIKDNTPKPTWMAVSDNGTGMVWVDERLVWSAMKEIAANKDTRLLLADANTADRRDYLYTAIREFGRQDVVVTSMMGDGYYQVQVSVISAPGKNFTMFLIPFLPSAFGKTIAEMYAQRGELINKMVHKIVPKQYEVQQCANV